MCVHRWGDKVRHTQVDWRRQLRSVHHYPRTQAASRYGLRMLRMPGRCACGGLYAVNRSHASVKQSKRDRLTSLGGRKDLFLVIHPSLLEVPQT